LTSGRIWASNGQKKQPAVFEASLVWAVFGSPICRQSKNGPYVAAMKTSTTYPTKHPHWIDESDDSNNTKKGKRIGISFSVAVAIVVAIHLAVIGGIYVYTSPKPKTAAVKTPGDGTVQEPNGPKSDALARNEWPQPEVKPRVVAIPTPPAKKEMASKPSAKPTVALAEKPKDKPASTEVVAVAPKPSAPIKDASDEAKRKAFLATRSSKPGVEQRRDVEPSTSAVKVAIPAADIAAKPPATVPHPTALARTTIPVPQTEKQAQNTRRVIEYTLAAGDNLYLVARKLGVSFNDLARENGINDPRQLRIGQTLKVPAIASL
jgi:LysM repeat protein